VHTTKQPLSGAKTIPKESIECYLYLRAFSEKPHVSSCLIYLLIGSDFDDTFFDAKRNGFEWYVLDSLTQTQ